MSKEICRGMTKGEYRVGINFNPGGSDKVNAIKRMAADLIDEINDMTMPNLDAVSLGEVRRLQATAMTAVEDAAMWAVKAATKEGWR